MEGPFGRPLDALDGPNDREAFRAVEREPSATAVKLPPGRTDHTEGRGRATKAWGSEAARPSVAAEGWK